MSKQFKMMTNLRDIKAYDENTFDSILSYIKEIDPTLHELVQKDLLPLKILGFPVLHRKVLMSKDKDGTKHFKSSFIVRVYKRKCTRVVVDAQIYLGENKLDLKEIKSHVIDFFHARPDIVRQLELEDDLKKLAEEVIYA